METLFTVETDRLRLTWSGPRPAGAGGLAVRSLDGADVRVSGDAVAFEEETTYAVLVQSLDGAPVEVTHRDPVVTAGLVRADGGRVVHGHVRFGSQAGRTAFVLRAGGAPHVEVKADVLPTKLSMAQVDQMQAEVEAAAAGLSLSVLRPATRGFEPEAEAPPPVVWLAALRRSVGALAVAVREVERRPALETVRQPEAVETGRVARPTSETRRSVAREGFGAERVTARPPRLSDDTPAHRWLAARLADLDRRLAALDAAEKRRRPSARQQAVLDGLDGLHQSVAAVRSGEPWQRAGRRAPAVPPLVLRSRAPYSQAFDALRQIERGFALRDGALDVSMHDLSALYETWAALAVVRAFAAALGVDPPTRPFGVDVTGTSVRLRRGREHAVRLAAGAVWVEIEVEPRFPAPPALLAQRPDLLVTVRRGADVRRVVLDAKYRRDDSAGVPPAARRGWPPRGRAGRVAPLPRRHCRRPARPAGGGAVPGHAGRRVFRVPAVDQPRRARRRVRRAAAGRARRARPAG